MDKPLTSEEKLLKHIRKKDRISQNKSEQVSHPKGLSSSKKIQLSTVNEKKTGLKWLKIVNQLLIVGVIGLVAFNIYRFLESDQGALPKSLITQFKNNQKEADIDLASDEQKPFDSYKSAFEQQNIFQMPWEKPKKKVKEEVPKAAVDISSEYQLMGIVLDKNPQAIIQDIKQKQTHFLSQGEKLGEAVLKKIYEDRVLFEINGEEAELSLQ